jgi:hypothetical protein
MIGEAKEYILWAVPKGETDQLHAKPIYTQGRSPQDVERVKALAAKEGWHSFRVQVLDLAKPFDAPKAFAKAVRPDAADRVLRSKRGRKIGEEANDITEADKTSPKGTKAKVGDPKKLEQLLIQVYEALRDSRKSEAVRALEKARQELDGRTPERLRRDYEHFKKVVESGIGEEANDITEADKKYKSLKKAVLGRVSKIGTDLYFNRSGNTLAVDFNYKEGYGESILTATYNPKTSQWSVYVKPPKFHLPKNPERWSVDGKRLRKFGHHIIELSSVMDGIEAMLKDTKPEEWED